MWNSLSLAVRWATTIANLKKGAREYLVFGKKSDESFFFVFFFYRFYIFYIYLV